jgi:hypothetical protein
VRGGYTLLQGRSLDKDKDSPEAEQAQASATLQDTLRGRVLRRYRVAGCVDGKGAPVGSRLSVFSWMDRGSNAQVLEVVSEPDQLLIENSFMNGAERVFQAVLSSPGRPQLLMDVRLPTAGGWGRLALTRSWQEQALPELGFRAYFSEIASACSLEELPAPGALQALGSTP